MRDLIGTAIILGIVGIPTALLLYARHLTVSAHREQFKATGGAEFALPSERDFEREAPEPVTRPVATTTLLDTETGEMVRLGADGLPMSQADVSARTPSTALTVDPTRLAEILTLEETGEYQINAATWAEIGAADAFMRDPLGAAVLPPIPLVEEAGNPALADAFWRLINEGGLTTDWSDADSEFHFWTLEPAAA
jgi:hypothetical protein